MESFEIFTVSYPFDLYHITRWNTPLERKQYEEDMTMHGESDSRDIPSDFPFSDDRKNPKFFGLTEEFTRHYSSNWRAIQHVSDGRESGLATSMFARLKYQTKSQMRLILLPDSIYVTGNTITYLSGLRGIDGWIRRDDPADIWYEILLFKPEYLLKEDFTILNRRLIESEVEDYTIDDLLLVENRTVSKSVITLDPRLLH